MRRFQEWKNSNCYKKVKVVLHNANIIIDRQVVAYSNCPHQVLVSAHVLRTYLENFVSSFFPTPSSNIVTNWQCLISFYLLNRLDTLMASSMGQGNRYSDITSVRITDTCDLLPDKHKVDTFCLVYLESVHKLVVVVGEIGELKDSTCAD